MARGSLKDDKTFERFGFQLFELVPQLDRVCVTTVENDKLRLKMLQERLGLKTSLRSRSTVVKAAGQSLADYALGDKTAVNQEMGQTKGSVMVNMARKDIRSSMHVPVEISGVRCNDQLLERRGRGVSARSRQAARANCPADGRRTACPVAAEVEAM